MIGGGGKGRERYKQHYKMFLCLLQLVRGFCTENIIRKKCSGSEQASNETVAKTSWKCLFANPHRYMRATDQ